MTSLPEFLLMMLAMRRATGEAWSPGDLAICIAENWSDADPANPKVNDLLRVRHVCMGGLFLHFHAKPEGLHWEASAFREVQQDTKPAEDEAWVEQLKHFRRREPV